LTLKFYPLFKNFNIGHIFWMASDRAFIFHMCVPFDKTFLLVPNFLPCDLDLERTMDGIGYIRPRFLWLFQLSHKALLFISFTHVGCNPSPTNLKMTSHYIMTSRQCSKVGLFRGIYWFQIEYEWTLSKTNAFTCNNRIYILHVL
jgi:hypothetical protein